MVADDGALSLLAEAGDGSMRDALSIMDQAIASAPVEPSSDGSAGQPRLDASQIRELMGTVPNAVFEQVLQAVDANQSAEVITVANRLLDAGNSPQQLARQFVRFLRNTLIAKIAGLQAETVEETGLGGGAAADLARRAARAARAAALFSEEELTRFLQVMLRTFDELGYRQEQRFHFELGLLKLVHLRRLLPIEEALSQMGPGSAGGAGTACYSHQCGASGCGVGVAGARCGGACSGQERCERCAAAAQPAAPGFSPFEQDRSRRGPVGAAETRPVAGVSSAGDCDCAGEPGCDCDGCGGFAGARSCSDANAGAGGVARAGFVAGSIAGRGSDRARAGACGAGTCV